MFRANILKFLPALLLLSASSWAQDVEKFEVRALSDTQFPLAVGSGLTLLDEDIHGGRFLAITDRGPNADGPVFIDAKGGDHDTKVFGKPEYVPSIVFFTLNDGVVTIDRTLPLKWIDGAAAVGLPREGKGATHEIAIDAKLNPIPSTDHGIDPEGIIGGPVGTFWVVDEYGPFLLKVKPDGTIIEQFGPGDGLPRFLAKRSPNRGFEGITKLDDGTLVLAMQSELEDAGIPCHVIPIVLFNPDRREASVVPYTVVREGEVKLGDVTWIEKQRLLFIENTEDKNGKRSALTTFDIAEHTVQRGESVDQNLARLCNSLGEAPPQLLSLTDLGWTHEKTEGVALSRDHRTVYVINDSDFGFEAKLKIKPKHLELRGASGEIMITKRPKKLLEGEYDPAAITELWAIHLKKRI